MGASESAAGPGSDVYVESGRVGRSFLPLALGTLFLALLLAWGLAWSRMHWVWPIIPVLFAGMVLVQAVKLSIERGQCRRLSAGLTLAVTAGFIMYVGSWVVGYELYVVGAGVEAVGAVRTSTGLDGVLGWYVFVARRDRFGSPLSSVVHAFELCIAMLLQVGAARDLGRRVFDERLGAWAQRWLGTFRAADVSVVRAAVAAGNFGELARLPRLIAGEDVNPGVRVLVDHFGGPTTGPTYVSLRLGRTWLTPFIRLGPTEAAAFWTAFGAELGGGGQRVGRPGATASVAISSDTSPPIALQRTRIAATSSARGTSWRAPVDPSAEVGRATRTFVFVLAGLFGFGVLSMLIAAFVEQYKVDGAFPEPVGAIHTVTVVCGLTLFGACLLVLLLAAPLQRWRDARVFSRRPGSWLSQVPEAERLHLNVCETRRYNARRAVPDDYGFWLLDTQRRRLLFEGLRERWVIDGRDVDRIEVLQDHVVDAFVISFVERDRQVEVVIFDASVWDLLGFRGASPVQSWVDRFRACLGRQAVNSPPAPAITWRTLAPGALIMVVSLVLGSVPFRQWRAPDLGDLTAAEARLREPAGFFGRVRGRVVSGSVEVGRRNSETVYVAFDLAGPTAGLLVSGSEHQLRALGALEPSADGEFITVAGFVDDSVPSEVGPLLEDATGLRVPSDARVIQVGLEPHSPRSLGATIMVLILGMAVAAYVTYRLVRSR